MPLKCSAYYKGVTWKLKRYDPQSRRWCNCKNVSIRPGNLIKSLVLLASTWRGYITVYTKRECFGGIDRLMMV
jgi:hypothetical protein